MNKMNTPVIRRTGITPREQAYQAAVAFYHRNIKRIGDRDKAIRSSFKTFKKAIKAHHNIQYSDFKMYLITQL